MKAHRKAFFAQPSRNTTSFSVGLTDSTSADATQHIVGTTQHQGSRCLLNT